MANCLLFLQKCHPKQWSAVGCMDTNHRFKRTSWAVITRLCSCTQAGKAAGSEGVLSSDTPGKQGSPDLFTTLSSCFSKWILLLTRHIQATHTHTHDLRLSLLQLWKALADDLIKAKKKLLWILLYQHFTAARVVGYSMIWEFHFIMFNCSCMDKGNVLIFNFDLKRKKRINKWVMRSWQCLVTQP